MRSAPCSTISTLGTKAVRDDDSHSNAAPLIAAAPDLLEALEAIYPMLPRSLTTVAHGDPSWTEAIRKVEAAVAKARGQSSSTDTARATE